MKSSISLSGLRRSLAPKEHDQDFLEGLVVPLLISLMGVMVLSLLI